MFRFRLQPVLNYRYNLEDEKKRDLGRAVQKLVTEQDRLRELKEERKRVTEEMNRIIIETSSGEVTKLYSEFFDGNDDNQAIQERRIQEELKIVEQRRGELVLAMKNRRTLEVLRDRKYSVYLTEERRKERFALDEMASIQRAAFALERADVVE